MFRNYQLAYLVRNVKIREVRRLTFQEQAMAHVLSKSARQIPHGAVVGHFDATPLVEYGKIASRAAGREGDAKPPESRLRRALYRHFWPFFIKTMAHSLHHVPHLNVYLDYTPWRTSGRVYMAEDINIGFTVHTKFGVLKPVMRNAHQKDLETVAREMRQLARRARHTDVNELYHKAARAYLWTSIRELDLSGLPGLLTWLRARLQWRKADVEFQGVAEKDKLGVRDILGATTTVANIGTKLSGHHTVGVIMPPEIMSFGIGEVREVPWILDGKVVPRFAVTIAGTIDHRVFDGGDAFPLYQHVKHYIDNPHLIYDWKPGDDV